MEPFVKGLRIGIDIDEVTASMIPVWVDIYNEAYSDCLKVEQITDWDMTKFVKPECGKNIYQILAMPTFYDNVKPIDGAFKGIEYLRRNGAEIYYVSSCVPATMDMKAEWLARHDPNFDWKKCFFCHDKFLLDLDVLVDDGPHNLESAPIHTATVRYRTPYNVHSPANAHVSGWNEIPTAIGLAYVSAFMENKQRYVEAI